MSVYGCTLPQMLTSLTMLLHLHWLCIIELEDECV